MTQPLISVNSSNGPIADGDEEQEDDADGDKVHLVEHLGQARHGDPALVGRVHAHHRAEVRREATRHDGVGEDVLHDQVRSRQERRELPCMPCQPTSQPTSHRFILIHGHGCN
jgi:hypothetical protein